MSYVYRHDCYFGMPVSLCDGCMIEKTYTNREDTQVAKYDFGGGCPCGVLKECNCGEVTPEVPDKAELFISPLSTKIAIDVLKSHDLTNVTLTRLLEITAQRAIEHLREKKHDVIEQLKKAVDMLTD